MGPADIHRVPLIENVIDLSGEVVLAFGLRRDKTEARDVESIANGEIIWQWSRTDDERRGRIWSKTQRIRKDVVRTNRQARHWIAIRIDRRAGLDRVAVNAALYVAKYAVARLLRVNRAIHEKGLTRAQQLQVCEKEGFVFAIVKSWTTFTNARQVDRAADRSAEDVLHELRPLSLVDDIVVLVRMETRRLIELEERSVKIV